MNLVAPIEPAVIVRDIFDAALHREPNAVEMRFWAANVARTGSCRDLLQKLSRSVGAWRVPGDGGLFAPPGHFYSPIVDAASLAGAPASTGGDPLPEIAIDDAAMLELWRTLAPLAAEASFPDHAVAGRRFYRQNPNFSDGDAVILSAMFGHLRPRRVVEVGAGFSSACMLDVRDDRKLAELEFTFIDPDPSLVERLAGTAAIPGVRIVPRRVQEAERSIFESLGAGDVLFIDSSHVAKTGSDVNHLVFSVLPALRRGVVVHFHDIFDGFEYPRDWLVRDNRSWNEIYFVRAFLMHNRDYGALFFNDRFLHRHRRDVEATLPRLANGLGGGLWLQKLASPVGRTC